MHRSLPPTTDDLTETETRLNKERGLTGGEIHLLTGGEIHPHFALNPASCLTF
jgi:hypothetical protein